MEKTSKTGIKVGDRVGCFLSVVDNTALWLGWGTYMGEEVPPNEGHESLTSYLSGLRQMNPKILLDSGDVVWGCECWWGREEEVKAERAQMEKIVDITIADARQHKIPHGFESPCAPAAPAQDDFWGSGGNSGDKDFWS